MANQRHDWRESASADYLLKRNEMREGMEKALDEIRRLHKQIEQQTQMLKQLDNAARMFGIAVPGDESRNVRHDPGAARTGESAPQFKEAALAYLRRIYPKTAKASELTASVEKELGRKFHEKTAGMTLYRFSRNNLAERIGHSEWRYIPQEGEGREDNSQPSIL